jgi:hypothetical protein
MVVPGLYLKILFWPRRLAERGSVLLTYIVGSKGNVFDFVFDKCAKIGHQLTELLGILFLGLTKLCKEKRTIDRFRSIESNYQPMRIRCWRCCLSGGSFQSL